MFRSVMAFSLTCLASLSLLFSKETTQKPQEELDFEIRSYAKPEIATTFCAFSATTSEAYLILSDGSVWRVRNLPVSQVEQEVAEQWRVGDDVRLAERTPQERQGNFLLKNARTGAVYLVDLDSQCADFSKASIIDKVDQNGYAIMMNGGSEWAIGYLGSFITWHWRPYDRVIINKSSYHCTEDYLLIHADDASTAWASLIMWK